MSSAGGMPANHSVHLLTSSSRFPVSNCTSPGFAAVYNPPSTEAPPIQGSAPLYHGVSLTIFLPPASRASFAVKSVPPGPLTGATLAAVRPLLPSVIPGLTTSFPHFNLSVKPDKLFPIFP